MTISAKGNLIDVMAKSEDGTRNPTPPRSIGFILLPEFSNMGLAMAVEPLFIANWLAGRELFTWTILSRDGLSVRASNGMHIPVMAALGDARQFDTVFVAASFNARAHAKDHILLNWLRRAARFGVTLGGIETGSEVLAAAGLLDGYAAAIHWYNTGGFSTLYPKVAIAAKAFSANRDRITCGCGTASLDMMLHLVATHAGQGLADEVALHVFPDAAAARQDVADAPPAQPPNRARTVVDAAVGAMQDAIETPLSCGALAAQLNVSERQLQRHFKSCLGTSIAQHNLTIRLERAHQYVQQTDLSITEVAIACGFGSPEHFSRLYRRTFGIPPSTDRHQIKSASVFRKRAITPRRG